MASSSLLLSLDISTYLIALVVFLIIFAMLRDRNSTSTKPNLPPGPKGWPIVGNLLSLNPKTPYVSLSKMAAQYGPIFSLRFGSFPVVVLSSYDAVKEAFVKRGEDYDDRPRVPVMEIGRPKGRGR